MFSRLLSSMFVCLTLCSSSLVLATPIPLPKEEKQSAQPKAQKALEEKETASLLRDQTKKQQRVSWSNQRAEPAAMKPIREILTARLAGYTGMNNDQFFHFYGISAELRFLRPFAFEVGFDVNPVAFSVFGRGGYSLDLLGRRDPRTGAGVTFSFGAWLGYRFLRIDDEFGLDEGHAVTATVSLDLYFWIRRNLGINFHVSAGTGVWFLRTDPAMPLMGPEGRVAVGLAF